MNFDSNIWKYYFFSVFTKQIIVPILVIFLLAKGINAEGIGILFSVGTLIGVVLEAPSGFLSDRIGHKTAIAISFFLQASAMLVYAWGNAFGWFIFATALYATGSSFWSGTGDAFLFETLKNIAREDDYESMQGTAVGISQPISAAFLVVVPFLYIYNRQFPFYLNFILLAASFLLSLTLVQPPFAQSFGKKDGMARIFEDIKRVKDYVVRNGRFAALMIFFGTSDALQDSIDQFGQIYFTFIGIPQQFFGFIYAANRILQGAGGSIARRAKEKINQISATVGLSGIISLFFALAAAMKSWAGVVIFPIRNFFEGLFDPIQSGYLNQEITAGDRIALLSVANLLSALVRSVLLVVLGFLFDRLSVPGVFELMAIASFVVLGTLSIFVKKRF